MSPRPNIDHIRRPQILAAAAEVIAERGVAGTRIADVAKRSGVSPPAVLYWFDSKESLLAEALVINDNDFYGEMSRRLDDEPSAGRRMVVLIETWCETADDFALWMELWTSALRDAELRGARERFDTRWRDVIATIVAEGVAAGEFAVVDPAQTALAIAALIDGLTVQTALGDPEVSANRLTETVLACAERLLGAALPVTAGDRASS